MKLAARNITQHLRRARDDEAGGLTIFGLYLFAAMAIMGGIAIDTVHLIGARTELQVTADAVAHAALYNRDKMDDPDDAIAAAVSLAQTDMPAIRYGSVIEAKNVQFGEYDTSTGAFTFDANSTKAVLVTAQRNNSRDNAVSSFLLQLVGFANFDIVTQAVYTTYKPACFREGFVADGVVDIQSNNGFSNGFCIHSNAHVSLNSNNTFEAGTVVSMPDSGDIDLPNSGWEKNEGLADALREGAYRMRLINDLPRIIDSLEAGEPDEMPGYIDLTTIEYLDDLRTIGAADLVPNRLHIVTCRSGRLTVDGGTLVTNVVIVTPCEVKFGNGTILEDAIVATTNLSSSSFNSPNGLQIGRDDNCAPGGGAQLMTLGGMNFASSLQVYNGQLIAVGNIEFAANADGIKGASMISGGEISGTSNMSMGFCGTGMEDNFEAEYFRLSR